MLKWKVFKDELADDGRVRRTKIYTMAETADAAMAETAARYPGQWFADPAASTESGIPIDTPRVVMLSDSELIARVKRATEIAAFQASSPQHEGTKLPLASELK